MRVKRDGVWVFVEGSEGRAVAAWPYYATQHPRSRGEVLLGGGGKGLE